MEWSDGGFVCTHISNLVEDIFIHFVASSWFKRQALLSPQLLAWSQTQCSEVQWQQDPGVLCAFLGPGLGFQEQPAKCTYWGKSILESLDA